MTGCLLDTNDLNFLQLLDRNLQLMFGSPSLLFYLDVLESFLNYYFVTFSLLLLLEFLMKTLYDELITKQKVTWGHKWLQEVTRV